MRGVMEAELPCGTPRAKASLLRIEGGRTIPRHTHRGDDFTLVRDGRFRAAHQALTMFWRGSLAGAA